MKKISFLGIAIALFYVMFFANAVQTFSVSPTSFTQNVNVSTSGSGSFIITNTGDEETTYAFAVSGYSNWASSAKINSTLTLAAGQSGDVWVTLDVDKKTSGDQTFNIEASSEGKLLKTQPVQVGIEGKQGFNISDSDSLVAILIALISAIVIAIIIVLIVKASRK